MDLINLSFSKEIFLRKIFKKYVNFWQNKVYNKTLILDKIILTFCNDYANFWTFFLLHWWPRIFIKIVVVVVKLSKKFFIFFYLLE